MRTLLLTGLCAGLMALTGCQSMKSGCADGGGLLGCAADSCSSGSCGDCASCGSRGGLLNRMGGGGMRDGGGMLGGGGMRHGGGCPSCGVQGCNGACRGGLFAGGQGGGLMGGGLRNAICGTCGVQGCDGRCNRGLRGRLGAAMFDGPAPVGHVPPDSRRVRGGREIISGPAGPPSATYTYPYYTTRGPRDYFDPDPPSIGY